MAMSQRPFACFKVIPTLIAGAYATGNVMGGAVKVENAAIDSTGALLIDSLTLLDLTNSKVDIDINIFSGSVSPGADKTAFTLSATDAVKWVGCISFKTADYVSSAAQGLANKANVGLMVKPNSIPMISTVRIKDLYVVFVARAAYTATTATNLQLNLGVEQG